MLATIGLRASCCMALFGRATECLEKHMEQGGFVNGFGVALFLVAVVVVGVFGTEAHSLAAKRCRDANEN